ncbi:hypothetical protein TRFO_22327 [Tritrichomonas foetus]|uniref:Endoplasmic reticulum-Golgi intermediate compartment protein 3 n=1 Tax=Tritrichomonas foetus TaxID=1144522 RepID=A0A1J4KH55_9EUKA|nr:hypothetical protein TRFO_22327 [Tritrichomonas foetus]|eukprot:OHT08982.1 hypothetical protein TRFO_22327 [Tritrichomonas foetus]
MASFFQAIDLFDKVENGEDYRKETKVSVMLSIILTAIGCVLVTFQLIQYFSPEYIRDLSIKTTNRNEAKLVNISLTVQVDLPCFFLHIDSLDSLGYSQLNINTTVSLIRLEPNGRQINRSRYSLENMCQSCYGFLPEGQCCNSCEELMLLATLKKQKPTPENWTQCNNKIPIVKHYSPNEKCLIKGKITVNKVQGLFHIAPGRNVKGIKGHAHDISYRFPHYNLSHKITRLYFGPKIPRTSTPLNNVNVIQRTALPTRYMYNMIVTPIKFYKNGKFIKKSFEYSAMSTSASIRGHGFVPGLFFKYSFTPYTITVTASTPSILQLVSSTCGLLAGMYAVASMIDFLFNKPNEAKEI